MSATPKADDSVYIILATYNGERFLQAQLDSIRNQTYTGWRLLISDDGSTDGTVGIALAAAREDQRICVLPNQNKVPLGAMKNFGSLLVSAREAGATVCFMADQDDIWFAGKIESQLRNFPLLGVESQPILAHSDMQLIDEEGEVLAESFFNYRALPPAPAKPFNQLLSMNYVTGCSACVNRRLLAMAAPVPDEAIMHDWWLALVASACGEIHYDPGQLLAYRQHEHNVVGAEGEKAVIRRASEWGENWQRGNAQLNATFQQAAKLVGRLQEHQLLPEKVQKMAGAYLGIMHQSRLGRIRTANRLGLRQGKILLRLVLYWRLLCTKASKHPASLPL